MGDALENVKDLVIPGQNSYVEAIGRHTEGAGTRVPWVSARRRAPL